MSCFPELTYAFFVDGELDAPEARSVEAHLIGCRTCRALVVGLQDETTLLTDVLHERVPQSYRLAPRAAPPPRELAMGVVPMVGLGVLALAVLGWIFESLPAGVEWLNPFRLQGVYEMAFNFLFVVRDDVPGLLEFLIALAGLASVSLLLLFAVSVLSRRFAGTAAFAVLLLALLAVPRSGAALDLHFHEDEVSVPAGETRDETMIVNADTVRVDGVVNGDLIVLLAERLILRGEVKGNVFSSARTIEVSGKVEGNLHAIGEKVRLDGEVGGNMYSASELLTLAEDATVKRDATHAAGGATIEGRVERDLFMVGHWLDVRGNVARNVGARADRVSLLDGARVGGDVDATFWDKSEVEVAPGAEVGGEVRSSVHEGWRETWYSHYADGGFYVWLVIRLGAAFALGLLLHFLAPRLFDVQLTSGGDFARSIGVGFLVLVATPIALLLIGITLLGIPIAVIGLAAFLSALYISGIVIAALVGSQITKPRSDTLGPFAAALLAGLAIVIVASELPLLGGPVRFVVVLTGLGLLVQRVYSAWHDARSVAAV
jgi:cytoskeletal protein CcmA (bactofilin family)